MTLDDLIAFAGSVPVTDEEREAQRRSFVYGNLKIENDEITREIVDEAARSLEQGDAQ